MSNALFQRLPQYAFIALFSALLTNAYMQTDPVNRILNAVVQNNIELQTLKASLYSEGLTNKATNNLPDPLVSGYYLPYGTHPEGTYSEYQISQAFEFPSVYTTRSKWIHQQEKFLQLRFAIKRQEILLTAKEHCLHLIYLNKQMALEQERITRTKNVYEIITSSYDRQEASLNELNQAKIGWLQNQFNFEKALQKRHTVLLALEQLNGGVPVQLELAEYPDAILLDSFDLIWAEKISEDPVLTGLVEENRAAHQYLALARQTGLPQMEIGYNYQGDPSLNYSGFYAGLSIPLWNNTHKVKAANAEYESRILFADEKASRYEAQLKIKYTYFRFYETKYMEFTNILEGLSQDLMESYVKGEITYIQYYMERHFYKQAFDTYLEIEYELHRLKAELLAHRL